MGQGSEADELREEHSRWVVQTHLKLVQILPHLGEPSSFHQGGPISPGFLESLGPSELGEDCLPAPACPGAELCCIFPGEASMPVSLLGLVLHLLILVSPEISLVSNRESSSTNRPWRLPSLPQPNICLLTTASHLSKTFLGPPTYTVKLHRNKGTG